MVVGCLDYEGSRQAGDLVAEVEGELGEMLELEMKQTLTCRELWQRPKFGQRLLIYGLCLDRARSPTTCSGLRYQRCRVSQLWKACLVAVLPFFLFK